MRTVHLLLVAVLATTVIGIRLPAQSAPGTTVRVSHGPACCATTLTGTLIAATADSIRIQPGGAESSAVPITLSRRSVQRFERRERVGAHAGVGAIVGLMTGALAGGAIGTAADCQQCDGGNFARPAGVLVGGLVGILAGIIIGSSIPNYAWEHADVPRRLGLMPRPRGDIPMQVSLVR